MVPESRPRLFTSWYVVGLFACLGIVSIIDRIALSLLIQPMKADLGISDTQAGLLLGPAFALIYSVSAMPIAWGLDKYNRNASGSQ
jgi:predicted MFS family arabinose efflux permease